MHFMLLINCFTANY